MSDIAAAFVAFGKFLQEHGGITRRVTVLKPRWGPTYGQQDPCETEIEVVDMDALCKAIDEFGESLRSKS